MWWLIVVGMVLTGFAIYMLLPQLSALSSYQKKRLFLIILLCVGVATVCFGLYSEIGGQGFQIQFPKINKWIGMGLLSLGSIVIIWIVITWVASKTETHGPTGNYVPGPGGKLAQAGVNLLRIVGVIVTLILLGAVVHSIAQYFVSQQR